MKKILLSTLLVLGLYNTDAKANSIFFNEMTLGCSVGGLANGLATDLNTTNFAIGCLIGGSAAYFALDYAENKISDRYEERLRSYETQLDEISQQRAINSSKGIGESGIFFRRKRIPGKKLPNGSFQEPTFIYEPDIIGRDLVIGN
jgi:hypothetical protein